MSVERVERLKEQTRLKKDTAILIENKYNRAYFSGVFSSAGSLIVDNYGTVLLVDFRYIEAAIKSSFPGIISVLMDGNSVQMIGEQLKSKNINKVLVEDGMSLARFRALKQLSEIEIIEDQSLEKTIKKLRSSKEDGEIEKISKAQEITDSAFSEIILYIKPGMTEREIASKLEFLMKIKGADDIAFSTIVVSGENSSLPHGVPGDRKVVEGDFITMDFGAVKEGYCSDMTRTVALGEISVKQQQVYDTVLKAHLAARERAKAGMTGKELDAISREIIKENGYGDFFGHGLGHSLGLEVHEEPSANRINEEPLGENVIMTIEPGIYLPGEFGVRIENMIVLNREGNTNLSKSTVELITV